MNEGDFPQADLALTPILAQSDNPFRCKKCGWNKGLSAQALRMHDVRKHTGHYGRGRRAGKKTPPSQTREYKRQEYHKRVAEYQRRGLNAHGDPYKLPIRQVRNIQRAQKERREREGTSRKTWSPSARKRIHPIVFPVPADPGVSATRTIQYCPYCGEHLPRP